MIAIDTARKSICKTDKSIKRSLIISSSLQCSFPERKRLSFGNAVSRRSLAFDLRLWPSVTMSKYFQLLRIYDETTAVSGSW